MSAAATRPELAPWAVDDAAFPAHGPLAEQLRFLVRYAVLAPSTHNTQPWIFRLRDSLIELWADKSRALPVVDPDGRELVMSCGAALFHLRVAARAHGLNPREECLPEPREPGLFARFRLHGEVQPTARDLALFAAIPRRHTNRFAFAADALPEDLLLDLRSAAAVEGAWLHVFEGETKERVARLVMEGDREQFANRAFRRELSAWTRGNSSARADGVRGYSLGLGAPASYLGPFVVRTFDVGKGQAAKDRDLAVGSPVLALLGTGADARSQWLAAGQALAHVLLHAQAAGVSASFLNQPVEVPALRTKLGELAGREGAPQLLLRLGYPTREARPAPRRPVEDVVIEG